MNLSKIERVERWETTDGSLFTEYDNAKDHQRKIQSSLLCRIGLHSWGEWDYIKSFSETGNPFFGFGGTEVTRGYRSKRICNKCGKREDKRTVTWSMV